MLQRSSRSLTASVVVVSRHAHWRPAPWPSQLGRHADRCCCPAGAGTQAANAPAAKQPPRFYTSQLPRVPGASVQLDPDEARHAVRVLRLRSGDALQLCDGRGGLVACELGFADKSTATVVATAEAQQVPWAGPRWVVAAACLTLKGGRTDWLVEKATELGAAALLPLITERSQTGTTKAKFKSLRGSSRPQQQQDGDSSSSSSDDFQPSRLQRLALAATKQSLRVHALQLLPAQTLPDLLPELRRAPLSLVATAGAPPVLQVLEQAWQRAGGGGAGNGAPWADQACFLLVGPEGDFTPAELQDLAAAGVLPAGLGPHRLRTETAAVAALTAAALFADAHERAEPAVL